MRHDARLIPARMIGVLIFVFVFSGSLAAGAQILIHAGLGTNLNLEFWLRTLVILTLVSTIVLGVAHTRSSTLAGIDRTAAALLVFFLAGSAWPEIASHAFASDIAVLAEILVPIALMVAIQWGVLRRNWRHRHAS